MEKQISKPITMSNIKTQKFNGYNFYHTICGKANWEKKGNEYQSPQEKSFEKCNEGDIKLCIKNEKGSAYGSMPFEELNKIYTENHYLYEILEEKRKFYLDIEFPYITEEETARKLTLIFQLVKRCFGDCGIDTKYKRKRDFFSKNIGVGEQGGFKDIMKFSAHLVFNNGVYFKSVHDINKFAKYMRQTITEEEEYHDLIFETDRARDFAIDFGVYTKNRLFKLPYQSKPKSSRIQKPAPKTPDSLDSCLISFFTCEECVDVSKITIKTEQKTYAVKNKSGRIIGKNISNNVAEFLEEYKEALPDECPIPEGSTDSGSLEYVVKSIYNGKAVRFPTFCAVGMAICRASGGNEFQLWLDWCEKRGRKTPASISEMRGMWGRFSTDKGFGFTTLLNMAKLCNPGLITQHPSCILFDMPHFSKKNIVNKKYLEVQDFNLDKEVSFIKSPMGTGKSFTIHAIQENYKKIVYLSSKRAFATAMGKEFEEDGFCNYIDLTINERYDCNKLIISLESFHQINPDNIDLLIIDESESIFNIIGSYTLQAKGEGLNNLLVFEKAVRNSKRVLVMDAFLSKRSFNAINTIRPNASSMLTVNEWKPPRRTATLLDKKDTLYKKLTECLKAGERCVVVSGSKGFAIQLVANAIEAGLIEGEINQDGILDGSNAKLYHSGNPLDLSCKVNEEWSKCKLLCYSPTITCGVSYDNPDALFDRLFVYMPNIFSACFRDATQALKRVRHFTQDNIFVCLNTCGKYNLDMNPVYFDKVKELMYTHKKEIFTDEKHYISLQSTTKEEYAPLKNWVSEARIYNILEQNISGIYLEAVAATYLEIENIAITGGEKAKNYEMPEYEIKDSYTWEEVEALDYNINEINTKKEQNETLSIEEYFYYLADGFKETLKPDITEFNKKLYWEYYIKNRTTREHYYCTIKFNKLIQQKTIDELYEKTDSKKILELNDFHDERYSHLYKMFKQINIITEDNKLDYNKEFQKEDLEPLMKDYEDLRTKGGLKSFNQLLKHESIREWTEKENGIMDNTKMYIMMKHLAKDLLGLEAGRIKQKKKRIEVDGKKKQVFIGVFKFAPPMHIVKDDEGNTTDKLPLHVLNVAHEDFLKDLKPSDWFNNDSGITSEEECEDI